MDYASHGTLRQRHPKGSALSLPTIVSYIRQVADALQYAHDEKVIHRDVKPENMLIGRRDEILLSDFGIALVAQSSRYQSTQEMVGTMAYMAPEQIQGKPRPASDQYALGIVVYEWISGDRPFHGSLTEIVGQHLSVPPPPLHEKVPTISPEIEQVVLTALAKNPKDRFGNMRAFATAFEQAFQARATLSATLSPGILSQREASSPINKAVAPSTDHPADASTPPHSSVAAPLLAPPGESWISGQRLVQRIALLFLAGLLIVGGVLIGQIFSHPSPGPAISDAPSATSMITSTAMQSTFPTPTPTSIPTPTQAIVARPTLTTDCAHLVTPWVALYQYSNFGGRELCFEGKGLINLADCGFDKQTDSINIAANGTFFDQPDGKGTQLGFYYSDEKADLGTWDNRISSFIVTG
jgi:serine/threonine protein kinase